MTLPVTTHTGPLGSTFHILRADAETVTALAAVDWSRHFRRVCLDPVSGLITLMAPSKRHEVLTGDFDDLVEAAGIILAGAVRKLRSPRLRGRGDPPGTGMEPDAAFYIGERARGFYAAREEGNAAMLAYLERTAPDLVVEVEITNARRSKAERYGEMEVREMWRPDGRKDAAELRAKFYALHPGRAPRRLDASEVIEELAPEDVCEALDSVQAGPTPDDRREAVARIIRRRQCSAVQVREKAASYSARGTEPVRVG